MNKENDKTLISCCFILDGDLDIDESYKLKQEIEELVKKYCFENDIAKYERAFLSDHVVEMIQKGEADKMDNELKAELFKKAEDSPLGQWAKKWLEENKDNMLQRFKQ